MRGIVEFVMGQARTYRGPEACRLAGITYRQLDYWARSAFIGPSVMDANGSGTQRVYSEQDVWCLALTRQMLDAGLTLNVCRRTIPAVRGFESLDGLLVVIVDGQVTVCVDQEAMLDALIDARSAWVFRPAPCTIPERERALVVTWGRCPAGGDGLITVVSGG